MTEPARSTLRILTNAGGILLDVVNSGLIDGHLTDSDLERAKSAADSVYAAIRAASPPRYHNPQGDDITRALRESELIESAREGARV